MGWARMRRSAIAILGVATITIGITACTDGDATSSDGTTPSSTRSDAGGNTFSIAAFPEVFPEARPDLELEPCEPVLPAEAPTIEGITCLAIDAPLDYENPEQGTVQLAVKVIPATGTDPTTGDPVEVVGPLFVNFGGPGKATIPTVDLWWLTLPTEITSRFTIVGMDPRGVGESGEIVCGPVPVPVPDNLDLTPTDEEFAAQQLDNAAFAAACQLDSGDLLGAVGTDNVVRDIDLVLDQLGEEELSYIGYSYGTLLGARLAEAFPDRVRAMVMDGATDPTAPLLDRFVEMAIGRSRSFERFLEACAAEGEACAFYSDGDPGGAYDALMDGLRTSGNAADEQLATTIYDNAVGSEGGIFYQGQAAYDRLAKCLAALSDYAPGERQPDELRRILTDVCAPPGADASSDASDGGAGDGSARGVIDPPDRLVANPLAAIAPLVAINCADYPRPTREELDGARTRLATDAPRFQYGPVEMTAYCLDWPTEPTGTNKPITSEELPTVLVINTTHDGATPLATAERMVEALPKAHLIVLDGAMHGSFPINFAFVGQGPDECLDRAVIDYLLEPAEPVEVTECTFPSRSAEVPPGRGVPEPLFTGG